MAVFQLSGNADSIWAFVHMIYKLSQVMAELSTRSENLVDSSFPYLSSQGFVSRRCDRG